MVFSKEDIQNMGKEVDEDMSDQDLSDNDYNSKVNYEDDDSNGSDNQDRRKRELDNDSDSNPFGNCKYYIIKNFEDEYLKIFFI